MIISLAHRNSASFLIARTALSQRSCSVFDHGSAHELKNLSHSCNILNCLTTQYINDLFFASLVNPFPQFLNLKQYLFEMMIERERASDHISD